MVFLYLLLLFIVLPLAELALLLKVGEYLHWEGTIALVILTGVAGAALARWQGLKVLFSIQKDMAEGRMPAPYLLDGLMILLAGALLVTPGLITDAVGFSLLVPPVRRNLKQWLRKKLEQKFNRKNVQTTYVEW